MWISVEDKLPEKGVRVLLIYGYEKSGDTIAKKIPIIGMLTGDGWYSIKDTFSQDDHHKIPYKILYWMPLPEFSWKSVMREERLGKLLD